MQAAGNSPAFASVAGELAVGQPLAATWSPTAGPEPARAAGPALQRGGYSAELAIVQGDTVTLTAGAPALFCVKPGARRGGLPGLPAKLPRLPNSYQIARARQLVGEQQCCAARRLTRGGGRAARCGAERLQIRPEGALPRACRRHRPHRLVLLRAPPARCGLSAPAACARSVYDHDL
jgi:hypothetical protein